MKIINALKVIRIALNQVKWVFLEFFCSNKYVYIFFLLYEFFLMKIAVFEEMTFLLFFSSHLLILKNERQKKILPPKILITKYSKIGR